MERCPLSLHPLPLLDNQTSTLRPSDCVTSMIRKCCPLHHHYLSLFLSLAGSPRIAFPTRNLSLLVRTDPPLPSSSLPQPPPSQGDVFNPGADTRLQPWQLELVMGRKHGPVALPLPLPLAPLRPSIRCVPFTALLRAENCRSPLSMEGVEMLPNTPCPNLVRGMEEKAITELYSSLCLRLTCFHLRSAIDTGSIPTLHFRKHFVTRRITESSHLRAPTLPRRRVHTRRPRPRRPLPLPLALARGLPPALKVSSRGEC